MIRPITRHYSNGEVTVVWKAHICEHSGICAWGLSQVFDPTKRPWIDMKGAPTDQIIAQVKKCPSGALSFTMNDETTGHDPAPPQTR